MSESAKLRRPAVNLDEFERRLFATAPAERVNDDPLAELSRIVGKSDPFKGLFAGPATAAVGNRVNRVAEPNFNMPQTAAFARGQAAVQPQNSAQVVNFAPPRPTEAAPEVQLRADDAFAPHYFDESAPSPAQEQAESEFYGHHAPHLAEDASESTLSEAFASAVAPETRKRSLRGTATLMTVLVIAMVGGAAAIGLRGQVKKAADGGLPVVKAASTPVKVEPAKPETETAATASPATGNASAPAAEAGNKLVSKAEQPVEMVQIPGQPPIRVHRIIPLSGEQTSAIMTGQPSADQQPEQGLPQPRPVKTVAVKPDGSLIGAPVVKQAVALPQAAAPQPVAAPPTSIAQLAAQSDPIPAAPAPAAKLPLMAAAGSPARTPSPAAATPTDTAPVAAKATTPKATIRAAAPATKPVAAKPATDQPLALNPIAGAKPAPKAAKPDPIAQIAAAETPVPSKTATASSAGTFAVQLAAPPSEVEARAAATRLQGQYGSALGGHALAVRKADLGGGRTVYRVRVANLSRDEAVSICENLKASGGQCFISK